MLPLEKNELKLHRGPIDDPAAKASYTRLIHDVLSGAIDAEGPLEPWRPFALFTADRRCVATVEAAILPLVADGIEMMAAGIRSVAVDPDWRGQGLFRDLMNAALTWCDTETTGLTCLYTEDPALYGRFGFQPLMQHAFVGKAPRPSGTTPVRRLDLGQAADRDTIRALVGRRRPVSLHCALTIDPAQFLTNVAKDDDLVIAHVPGLDALIVYEANDDDLLIADIVAPAIPDLASVLGALGLRPARIKVLFPPDRLRWTGTAVREDTGLMIRGAIPDAMTRPFMFPPTAEF